MAYDKNYSYKGAKGFLWRQSLTNKFIMDNIGLKKDDCVLEVGCNRGELLAELKDSCAYCMGVDINTHADKVFDNIVYADAQSLQLHDNTFDVVISSHCIEHIPNVKKALRENMRVLKPGGRMFLVYPLEFFRGSHTLFSALLSGNNLWKLHLHRLTPKKLERMIGKKCFSKGIFFSPFPTYYTVFKK